MAAIIKLKSCDDKVFTVDLKAAQQSITIKNMMDGLGFTEEDEDEPIPLPNLSGNILEKVVQWVTHHKDDAPCEVDDVTERRTADIPEWDQEFLKLEQPVLFDLILAANYLDIKPLLDFTCKTVANMIKGKTADEIRRTFNIRGQEGDGAAAQPTGAEDAQMEA